ncbi:MAG: type IV pili methyl-accepting chemotaxis transducer N-terminal domain-containing protein, partial [Planctomycetota bacterium]
MYDDPNETTAKITRRFSQPNVAVRAMTVGYVAALCAIAIVTVAGHLVVRNMLAQSSTDTAVVNVAGRQRMLSQRAALLATRAVFDDMGARSAFAEEAGRTVASMRESHDALLEGGGPRDLPRTESEAIRVQLAKLEPMIASMESAVPALTSGDDVIRADAAHAIAEAESTFLPAMDAIVGQYDRESSSRIAFSDNLATTLGGLVLVTLLVEALLIFRPIVNRVKALIEHDREVARDAVELANLRARDQREIERFREEVRLAERSRDEAR